MKSFLLLLTIAIATVGLLLNGPTLAQSRTNTGGASSEPGNGQSGARSKSTDGRSNAAAAERGQARASERAIAAERPSTQRDLKQLFDPVHGVGGM